MNGKPTRRSFFGAAGAAVAAPLAASGAFAADAGSDSTARLAALEDENSIRALLPALLADPRRMTLDASVRSLAADAGGAIAFAADGTAFVHIDCAVEIAAPIESCGTLVEMARLQGDGLVVRTERRMLVSAFVKRDGVWKFESAKLEVQA
jgi:hypothetical protein